MGAGRLFHISENPKIKVFEPRPSTSGFDLITDNVVFAISEKLLHNYILPRNCPRVTFYATANTTSADIDRFFGQSAAEYIIAVESRWLKQIERTTLYCYEFPAETFSLLDECAGYYISYQTITPVSVKPIYNILEELLSRKNVELRFMPEIGKLADAVKQSSLNFSLIRMSNATLEAG